jgi:tetratricopeptide (TPR) repeat protein
VPLRVVDLELPIDERNPSQDRLWREVPRIQLAEGETYVFSGRLVRLDWLMLPERFGLELFAVTGDEPRSPNAAWQQPRGSPEHRIARQAAGLQPLVPAELPIPRRFANPAPARSIAPLELPTSIGDALERADRAIEVDDLPRADYYLRWALLESPDRSDVWLALANLHLAISPDSALEILAAGIAHNPRAAALHGASATIHGMHGYTSTSRVDETIALAQRAVELAPTDPTHLHQLAKAQVCGRRLGDATITLERLLERADAPEIVAAPWMVEEARCMLARLASLKNDDHAVACSRFESYHYFYFSPSTTAE